MKKYINYIIKYKYKKLIYLLLSNYYKTKFFIDIILVF